MLDDSEMGYFIEYDLRYLCHLQALQNAYPLAPEHIRIAADDLSDTLQFMLS